MRSKVLGKFATRQLPMVAGTAHAVDILTELYVI